MCVYTSTDSAMVDHSHGLTSPVLPSDNTKILEGNDFARGSYSATSGVGFPGTLGSSNSQTFGSGLEIHSAQSQRSASQIYEQMSIDLVSHSNEEREQAHAAWQTRFGVRQLSLSREDPDLFNAGRRLGGGGFGIVHQTTLNGIPLALKRTYPRKLTEDQLNEIKILGKITEQRHHHIVELVGSYVHRQRTGYELGLLIWPVAHCDLAALLHDLSTLGDYFSYRDINAVIDKPDDDLVSTLNTVSNVLGIQPPGVSQSAVFDVLSQAKNRLMESFGCIAEAVAYIHSHCIRHKDLKPSQILLSPKGLWLTDFGWSNDMSDSSQSATSGWDNMTARYQAPERASKQPCGRSEDVFALGCIFLEMSAFATDTVPLESTVRPWSQKGWSFQANLGEVYRFLDVRLRTSSYAHACAFDQLLAQMLSREPGERPMIRHVLQKLSSSPFGPSGGIHPFNRYFGRCCQLRIPTSFPGKYSQKYRW